jgi:hypothetical protein
MNGIHLDFQSIDASLAYAGVEVAVATTHEPYAAAYMTYLGAKPFGLPRIHQKANSAGVIKSEKVEAFSEKQFLYVCRSLDGITKVYQYFAPTGLLLMEAAKIAQEHYEMSTFDSMNID